MLVRPVTDLTLAALPLAATSGPDRAGALRPGDAEVRRWADRYLGDLADPRDPLVSPLLADDHCGLPPALVVTAEQDPLRGDGLRYVDALRGSGVRVEHAEVPAGVSDSIGGPGCTGRGRPPVDPGLEAIVVAALRRALT